LRTRAITALTCAVAAIAAPAAAAQDATLSTTQAAKSAKLAVKQDQGETARGLTCVKQGKLKARCRTRWRWGVRAFRGTVTITRKGTALSPVDTYRIQATGRARYLTPTRIDERGRVVIETRRARLGQTLRLFGYDFAPDDIEVTPGVAVDPFVPSSEYSTPDAGTRFVAYAVKVRNVGTRRYAGSLSSFDMILAGGVKLDPSYAPGCDGDLDMARGEVRLACVVFEVPVGAAGAQLQLTLGKETGVWTP
jgi:hypothetical protein